MIFLVAKRFWDERQKRYYPEKYAERQKKQEKLLSDLMASLNIDEKSRGGEDELDEDDEEEIEEEQTKYRPVPAPPKPPIARQPAILKNSMNDSYREEIVSTDFLRREATAYDQKKSSAPSRAANILKGISTPKNMLVIKEIFGPPKSMQIDFHLRNDR